MGRKHLTLVLVSLLLISQLAPIATGLAKSGGDNGFSETAQAILWSEDDDLKIPDDMMTGADYSSKESELNANDLDEHEYNLDNSDKKQFIKRLMKTNDQTWVFPPSIANKWNQRDVHDFDMTGKDKSAYPPHANLKDGEVIKDAYIEIFSLSPLTKVMESKDGKKLYLAGSGTATGIMDYRVKAPEDKVDEYPKKKYSIKSHETKAIIVRQGEKVVGKTLDSGSFKVNYENLDPGKKDRITVEAKIRVTVKKEVTRKIPVDHPDQSEENPTPTPPEPPDPILPPTIEDIIDDILIDTSTDTTSSTSSGDSTSSSSDGSDSGFVPPVIAGSPNDPSPTGNESAVAGDHDYRYETTTTTYTKTMTVSDSVSVYRIYKQQFTSITYAKMPDGSMEFMITGDNVWTGIHLPGKGIVNNRWKFYTREKKTGQWGTMKVSSEDGTKTRESNIKPARVYAYPAANSTIAITDDHNPNTYVVHKDGFEATAPQLGENIRVSTPKGEYVAPYKIIVHYPEWKPNGIKVSGVTRGSKVTPEKERTVEVRHANLDVTVLKDYEKQKKAKVKIKLTDAKTGDPIRTAGPDSRDMGLVHMKQKTEYVTVLGEKVNTGSDGTATVTVKYGNKDAIKAVYHNQKWWWSMDNVEYTSETTYTAVNPLTEEIMEFLYEVFLRSIPFLSLLFVLWLTNKAFGGNTGIFPKK